MIDQYMLRYFLAVAELGSFSRAARAVSVTQPTLSAGIAKLEREMGARLFDRDRQGVSLTLAGSRFLVRARRIAAEYQQALSDVKSTPEPSLLRVGLLRTIPADTLAAILQRHGESGSDEVLELIEGSERDLAERLERARIDVALTVLRPHHARFRPELLRRERYMMVLPRDHAMADADELLAENLARDRMVLRRHCEALPEINRFFTQRGVRPRFVLKTVSDARALAVVRAGLGVGMMPEGFDDGSVRFVPVRDFELKRDLGLLFSGEAQVAAAATSSFVKLVRAQYQGADAENLTVAPAS